MLTTLQKKVISYGKEMMIVGLVLLLIFAGFGIFFLYYSTTMESRDEMKSVTWMLGIVFIGNVLSSGFGSLYGRNLMDGAKKRKITKLHKLYIIWIVWDALTIGLVIVLLVYYFVWVSTGFTQYGHVFDSSVGFGVFIFLVFVSIDLWRIGTLSKLIKECKAANHV